MRRLSSVFKPAPNQVPTREPHRPVTRPPSPAELVDLIHRATAAEQLQPVLQISADTLRSHPSLLHTLTHQFVPLTERDPELLGGIAALCLEAARTTASATDVWVHLSLQLQRDDLSLPAARSLLKHLVQVQKNLPAGKAATEFAEAWAYMKGREKAQQEHLLQLHRQHSGAVDGRQPRTAFPVPTQPSHGPSKL